MNIVVFLGPSLPEHEARAILDGEHVTYRPPVAQSDLLSVSTMDTPDVIVMIDGVFSQSLSVWHKEILYALDQGIAVYGASSMGALRAAETTSFGMIGVGKVFEMYRDGVIEDDDEVALAHGPKEMDYYAVSVPMVNIRLTFEAARHAEVINPEACDQLIKAAKSLYYPERSYPSILEAAGAAGVSPDIITAVRSFIETSAVDQKSEDACLVLQRVADLKHAPENPKKPGLIRSHFFNTLYDTDRRVRHNGTEIPLSSIGQYIALHHPTFHDLNLAATNRRLALILAESLHVQSSDEEANEEVTRFKRRNGIESDATWKEWQIENDLNAEDLQLLFRELATVRLLQRWIAIRGHRGSITRGLLDELKIRNQYSIWAKRAANQEKAVSPVEKDIDHFEENMRELIREHMQNVENCIDTSYEVWAEESGFPDSFALRHELIRSRNHRKLIEEAIFGSETPAETHP